MFEIPHYHGIIRKVIVGFGTLFSNIQIIRVDGAGTPVQNVRVPLAYAPKEKWETRVDQDPDLTNHVYTTLPRMGFEITGYNFDPARMVNRNNTIKCFNDVGQVTAMYAPVPYNIDISLYAQTKGTEDGLAIVEQILPLFTPEYNLNLIAVPGMNVTKNVPIILNSVSVNDNYEGDFQTRRLVEHTFTFTAKVDLYGPIKTGKIITNVDTDIDTKLINNGEINFNATGNPNTGVITEQWTFNG
jgi:T4-like virus Myoviridae tail sheath stabiliser